MPVKYMKPPGMRGWNFSREQRDKAREEGKMLLLYQDMSGKCDLKCRYCQTRSGVAAKDELNLDERKNVIDQAKELGCEVVHIVGQGEPTIDPLFWEHIEYISDSGMIPLVFTHSMHIDKETAERLYALGCSVIVKIHSFDREKQDWMVDTKGYAEKRDMAIEHLFNAGFNKEKPTRMGVDVVINRKNFDEVLDIFLWARENNIFPEIKPFITSHRAGTDFVKDELQVKPEEVKQLFYAALALDREKFGYDWVPKPPWMAWQCDLYYYHIYVNYVGNVFPCVGFEQADMAFKQLGNVREKPLKEMWNHPYMQKIRNIDKYMAGACADCKSLKEEGCYGCPCRRLAATKDAKNVFHSDNCWGSSM
ncbi:radical SAM protein [Candidatus Micrarchaeota archaeon]|nr:radical SAM protein [Candidatus Micrarchaeota archaeon]MBU1939491.1 radical SAM protein [Candidatus Micrarchaeota archaeon]